LPWYLLIVHTNPDRFLKKIYIRLVLAGFFEQYRDYPKKWGRLPPVLSL
jgi:hypothetical protein